MSTSVIEITRKRMRNQAVVGTSLGLLCTVFTWIYEMFSHGAYSPHMRLMFLFPLVGCGLLGLGGMLSPLWKSMGRWALNFWNTAMASFTLGFLFLGIVNIAGRFTSNHLLYICIGAGFILLAIIAEIIFLTQRRKLYE